MSSLSVGVPPVERELRPLPWGRMAWVIWRQHRVAIGGVTALLGGVAAAVWLVGLRLHHAYAAAIACHPAGSPLCSDVVNTFNGTDHVLANGFVLQALPALIGAFVGAPILARELETGTYRYAWTQGFGRRRWTLAKLVALAAVLVIAAGAISILFSWHYQPYFAAGNQSRFLNQQSPLASTLFDLRGVAFAAWTLVAFAIGALAGMLTRRVVPAIVATLTCYAALAFAAGMYLRLHYLAPLVSSKATGLGSALILRQWWTKGGQFAFGRPPFGLLQQLCPPPPPGAGKGNFSKSDFIGQCLLHHGYRQWTSYQPASRFWSFQLIEAGWLLVVSAALIAATVWLVSRRAA